MKRLAAFALTIFALTSSSAFARYVGPIVVKSSGAGFTPPEWQMHELCEVYADKVVITRSYAAGEMVAKEVRPLTITGISALTGMAAKAALETLDQRDNGLCDAPSTSIYVYLIQPNDTVEQATLFTSGGCGSPRLERNGPYAASLKDLVNQYCSKMYDIGAR